MGYQPAKYYITNRGGLFFIHEDGITTGPFRSLRKAEEELRSATSELREVVVGYYDSNGNRLV